MRITTYAIYNTAINIYFDVQWSKVWNGASFFNTVSKEVEVLEVFLLKVIVRKIFLNSICTYNNTR